MMMMIIGWCGVMKDTGDTMHNSDSLLIASICIITIVTTTTTIIITYNTIMMFLSLLQ